MRPVRDEGPDQRPAAVRGHPLYKGEISHAPLVGGALATLECRTEQRVLAGDHTLVIGRVLSAALPSGDGSPLTYFRGRYRQLG